MFSADDLNRLQEIGQQMHRVTNLDQLCRAIAGWVEELSLLTDCVVYCRQGNILMQRAVMSRLSNQVALSRTTLPLGLGLVGNAALQGDTIYAADVSKHEQYLADERGGASELAVPIAYRGEVYGVLDSQHPEADGITPKCRALLETIATLAAPHFADLLSQDRQRNYHYAGVLAELANSQSSTPTDIKQTYAAITEHAARILRVGHASIWLFDDGENNVLRCVDSYALETHQHTEGAVLAANTYPNYFTALSHERAIIADDAVNDPRTAELTEHYLQPKGICALLDAPIRKYGQLMGVLCVEHTLEVRAWHADEASFVGSLADFVTIALISEEQTLTKTALIQSQKMESLGRLAGGIAHDFNNLLTVISGSAETLLAKHSIDQSQRRLLTLISEASSRASKLTRNLMAFGGRAQLELSHVSVESLLAGVQELTQGIIREDIDVQFDTPQSDTWLEADRTQLEQVILNLMINGIDAMPDGGRLTVAVTQPEDPSMVGICVTDSGGGMDELTQQRIFEPFFTTKGAQGTGLGLSISLGIVQQHKGTITCFSSPQGSRFEVQLPKSQAPPVHELAQTQTQDSVITEHAPTVLLVEDEEGVRSVVTQMLHRLNYQTLVAENAAHALELLKQHSVDILITDVIMPDMRGPQLYAAAIGVNRQLSALFISGYSEDVVHEIPTGVGYLSKPFTMQQLATALQTCH